MTIISAPAGVPPGALEEFRAAGNLQPQLASSLALSGQVTGWLLATQARPDGDAWRLRGQITARGTTAPAELTITEATASEDVLLIRATTRIDRYAHGLTRAKGIAGRHLAMEITARATRS